MIASIPLHPIHKAAKRALTNPKVKSLHGKHAAATVGAGGVVRANMIDTSESLASSGSTAANKEDVSDKANSPGVAERLKAAQAAMARTP